MATSFGECPFELGATSPFADKDGGVLIGAKVAFSKFKAGVVI